MVGCVRLCIFFAAVVGTSGGDCPIAVDGFPNVLEEYPTDSFTGVATNNAQLKPMPSSAVPSVCQAEGGRYFPTGNPTPELKVDQQWVSCSATEFKWSIFKANSGCVKNATLGTLVMTRDVFQRLYVATGQGMDSECCAPGGNGELRAARKTVYKLFCNGFSGPKPDCFTADEMSGAITAVSKPRAVAAFIVVFAVFLES